MGAEPEYPTDLRLITALRYDSALLQCERNTGVNHGRPSAYLLLPYHHERLVSAAHAHGSRWAAAARSLTLDAVQDACDRAVSQHGYLGPLKVHFFLRWSRTAGVSRTASTNAHCDRFDWPLLRMARLAPPPLECLPSRTRATPSFFRASRQQTSPPHISSLPSRFILPHNRNQQALRSTHAPKRRIVLHTISPEHAQALY